MRAVLLAGCLAVAACATDTSTCPPPVDYTIEEKQAAGAELEQMIGRQEYPTIQRFMGDYKAERAQLRACFN